MLWKCPCGEINVGEMLTCRNCDNEFKEEFIFKSSKSKRTNKNNPEAENKNMKYFRFTLILLGIAISHFVSIFLAAFLISEFNWSPFHGDSGMGTTIAYFLSQVFLVIFHFIFIVSNTVYLYSKKKIINQKVRLFLSLGAACLIAFYCSLGRLSSYFATLTLFILQSIPLVVGNRALTKNFIEDFKQTEELDESISNYSLKEV